MEGTVRTLSPQLRASMRQMVERVVEGCCRASGAEGQVEYRQGYPPVVADPAVVEAVRRACAGAVGAGSLVSLKPVMGSEDFSLYLERLPGAFVFLGAGQPGGRDYPHHHPRFDFDEAAMALGVEIWCRSAFELLDWV
ncbi:MAG: M20/M25/M40 family metallo-hydrolase [Acetobacteraceae bacterium]|nr:M20/M25/M40 family metallo-hydrolase [Acetobacteraceae bacterium]